jgi:SAM-dependent methyltransferase
MVLAGVSVQNQKRKGDEGVTMDQSKKVKSYYNHLSQFYDSATKGRFEWTPPTVSAALLKPHLSKESKVLDVGIGTGQSAEILAELGCEVCGVDISDRMLEITRGKFPQFELHLGDLNSDLPFLRGRKFDAIVAVGVLEFVVDLEATLRRLQASMIDNGLLCFTIEEWVEGHPLQSARRSLSGEGDVAPGVSAEFWHTRYSKAEVELMLSRLNMTVSHRSRFQAYFKTSNMVPIHYWVFLAHNRS